MSKPRKKRILRRTAPQNRGKVVRPVKKGVKSQAILLTDKPLSVGQQVQLLRKVRGYSNKYLGDLIGISSRLIERIEMDDGGQNIATLEAIVAGLGGIVIICVPPAFNPADMIGGTKEDYIPTNSHKEIAYRSVKTNSVGVLPKTNDNED